MKKLLIILIASISILQLNAQTNQGTISYERKINLWKRIRNEEMKSRIPEFRTTHHSLLFKDTVSVYKTIQETEEVNPFGEGGGESRGGGRGFGGGAGGFGDGGGGGRGMGRMSRMLGSNDGDFYKNFSAGISIQATEQSGKNFLIVDTIRKQPWKLTEETKIILGYPCHKATMIQKSFGGGGGFGGNFGGGRGGDRGDRPRDENNNDTTKRAPRVPRDIMIVAWFADGINATVGPDKYGQLPGAILELDVDNGSMVFTATEIKKTVSDKDIKEPKKGKKVTRVEFMKLMADLSQHFGNAMPPTSGGDGN